MTARAEPLAARAAPAGPSRTAAIRAIALNTFREAIRDRVLYLLLVFSLIMIGVSRLLSLLTVGSEEKIVKDVGLSAISLFGVLTAVFVGVSLVFKEIERRTVYTLLANPVRRWQFLGGKFVGLLAVLAMNVALMSLALGAVLLVRGESPWSLAPAILLIAVELIVVTAFALLFSSLTNPILSALFTFAVYVAGHLSWSLLLLKEKLPEGFSRVLCDGIYRVLPDFERLNLKAQVVQGQPVDPAYLGWAVAYGVSYGLVVLALACWAFERKDFH
jgi:ABC-type transport system involved in multi-copper enzyme maturation permease subunit